MRTLSWAVMVALLIFLNSPVRGQSADTQTFTSQDGGFSFEYPVGWSAEVVEISNPPNQITVSTGGDLMVSVSSPTKFYAFPMITATTPKEMVVQGIALTKALLSSGPESEPQITEFTVNNLAVVVMQAFVAVTLIITLVKVPKLTVIDEPVLEPNIDAPLPVIVHVYDAAPPTGFTEYNTPFVF